MGRTGRHRQTLVLNPLAIDAHSTLLDHAEGLRGTPDQAGLLEQTGQSEPPVHGRQRHFGHVIRHGAFLEACHKFGLGRLGGLPVVEPGNNLLS